MRPLSRTAGRLLTSRRLVWLIIGLGILLRLASYSHNPSLWLDEISLASNIENGSYSGFLEPLKRHQAAPVGFLILERVAVQAFGDSEYVFRLVPLLAGLLSLFLFYLLCKRFFAPIALIIALGFFAVGSRLIYYSSEVKQYSSDVAIALALLLAAVNIDSNVISWQRAVLFGSLGAIAIWFSHPAVLVLAGLGTVLILRHRYERSWSKFALFAIAPSMWAASFVASYVFVLRVTSGSDYMEEYWTSNDGFMPFPPRAASDVQWFVRAFFRTFDNPAGFSLPIVAGITFLVGLFSAFKYKKAYLLMALSPIPFALLSSGLHKYPFLGRTILFIVPSLLIVVAEGIVWIAQQVPVAGVALAVLMFFHPIVSATHTAITQDDTRADIKPSLAHIRANWQPGDLVYVYYAAKRQFRYYSERYGFTDADHVEGLKLPTSPSELAEDVEALRGKERVWVLFLADTERETEERQFLMEQLDRVGVRLDSFQFTRVSIYLYDLRSYGETRRADSRVSQVPDYFTGKEIVSITCTAWPSKVLGSNSHWRAALTAASPSFP